MRYISKENGLEKEIDKKIEAIYKEKGTKRPSYQGKLPEGNDGLGLMLLGVTGDRFCLKRFMKKLKLIPFAA